MTQYFSCRNILRANKQVYNGCPKIIVFKYLALEEGGGGAEGFHIRLSCERSKRDVEFGI